MPRASLTILLLLAGCPDATQPFGKDHSAPDQPHYKLDTVPWPTDGSPDQVTIGDRVVVGDYRAPDLKQKLDGKHDGAAPPKASCGGTAKVVLAEVATGQPDYLSLLNTGPGLIDLKGFRLEMMGIGLEIYTFKAGESVAAGKILYVFEYAMGKPGDVNTGGNLPFYDSLDANSVALWDPAGNLLDFVAVGDKVVWLPPGASAAAVPWPAGYDPKTQSFQRVSQSGACPSFKAADWAAKPITRP